MSCPEGSARTALSRRNPAIKLALLFLVSLLLLFVFNPVTPACSTCSGPRTVWRPVPLGPAVLF
jgi:hypothetical protein